MSDYSPYTMLHVEIEDGVAFATIDAPPMNVMVRDLFSQLAKFGNAVAVDDNVRAVVLRSDDPDFFIAHFDVSLISTFPFETPAEKPTELGGFHLMCETYRTMPKPTIAEIAGRVGGGGNELAMSCDMRFGAIGKTVINQMEVPLGILPGGTGTQRLPRLVGRGRAMEIILGGVDIDAETAEAWGMLNRALPPEELRPHVTALAKRIAGYPPIAVAAAKASVANTDTMSLHDGMLEEAFLFQQTLRDPEARRRMERFIEVGGQTRDGEMNLIDTIDKLAE
ncbi:MAG: enoyl-CoA hydratase/isomerase family protein [Acidimicrobiaceae bacterium]|mgnify:FL=1|jgi:enoyl-CoA hydratase/carnithine racemase|nr:enoyl-CoA hydratase/isomerase family protein [Acidimicrobiaceae bacterium]MDA9241292.1 enoyl-CoA hydratase/isomerase family protein [bacterium]MDC1388263.1 enoyl-CoA hydratase/isomerase family protein [Acidimicrobiales bacterium]